MIQKLLVMFTIVATCQVIAVPVYADSSDDFVFVSEEGLNASDYQHIKAALYESRSDVLHDLGLTDIPPVIVRIWRDEALYQDAMEASLGSRAPGSRGYIVSDHEMRILLTELPTAAREAVHEFVHVASLNLNPEFGNNPRWLWEAVAIYFADETPRPQTLFLFNDDKCPTLTSLNQPFNKGGSIYDVGYYLIEFIENDWSRDIIVPLIKANADIYTVLGVNTAQFEARWCSFVRSHYRQ